MKWAREYAAERRPVAALGHMPFDGHRSCAESADDLNLRDCSVCNQERSLPCGDSQCGLSKAARP